MKIKIISDGTLGNTRFVDAETGEVVKGMLVSAVTWRVDVEHYATVDLTLVNVPVEVVGEIIKYRVPRTFYRRWIFPILHPVVVPFEPWVR